MTQPMQPRPDQRVITGTSTTPGSRSGSGELAGALGYPGVPPAVPNMLGATVFQQGVGNVQLFKFTQPGRIWTVILTFAITSNASFSLSTSRTVAAVQTATSGLTLAVIQLGVANPNQHAEGTCPISFGGLQVVPGEIVRLNVSNGTGITNLDQQASATMLYSLP